MIHADDNKFLILVGYAYLSDAEMVDMLKWAVDMLKWIVCNVVHHQHSQSRRYCPSRSRYLEHNPSSHIDCNQNISTEQLPTMVRLSPCNVALICLQETQLNEYEDIAVRFSVIR
eukprot:1026787_1